MAIGRQVARHIRRPRRHRHRTGEQHRLPPRRRFAGERRRRQQRPRRTPQASDMRAGIRHGLVEPNPGHRPRHRRRELHPQIHRAAITRIHLRRCARKVEDRVLRYDRRRRARRRRRAGALHRRHGKRVARPVRQARHHRRRRRPTAHLHRRLRRVPDVRGDRVAADRCPTRRRRIDPAHQRLPARWRRRHVKGRRGRGVRAESVCLDGLPGPKEQQPVRRRWRREMVHRRGGLIDDHRSGLGIEPKQLRGGPAGRPHQPTCDDRRTVRIRRHRPARHRRERLRRGIERQRPQPIAAGHIDDPVVIDRSAEAGVRSIAAHLQAEERRGVQATQIRLR